MSAAGIRVRPMLFEMFLEARWRSVLTEKQGSSSAMSDRVLSEA